MLVRRRAAAADICPVIEPGSSRTPFSFCRVRKGATDRWTDRDLDRAGVATQKASPISTFLRTGRNQAQGTERAASAIRAAMVHSTFLVMSALVATASAFQLPIGAVRLTSWGARAALLQPGARAKLLPPLMDTTAVSLVATQTFWNTYGNEIAVGSTLFGMAVGAILCVTYPQEMLRLALNFLAPVATHVERQRSEYAVGRLSQPSAFKDWTLPSLATLREQCFLLETSVKEEIFLCRKPDKGALSSDGCTFSRELSEHYGEPVFLCSRPLA